MVCDVFFDGPKLDLENWVGNTTPYAYGLENEKVIKLFEIQIDR